MEGAMDAAVGVLSKAKDVAFGKARHDGSKRRAKRKQPGGSEARKHSRKLMGLHAIRNTALRTKLEGHREIARRMAEEYRDKYDWLGIGGARAHWGRAETDGKEGDGVGQLHSQGGDTD